MPFVECPEPRANGASADAAPRSLASRLWCGRRAPGAALRALARGASARLDGPIGRVHAAGSLEDSAVERELRQAIAEPFSAFIRSRMEWYGCRGAFFHNDAHYDGVLFGVWAVAGPKRDLVFPRIGCSLPTVIGSIVVFDPFEPHAVLASGATRYRSEDYTGAAPSLFLGFEVTLTPEVMAAFGVGPAHEHAPTLSSRVAVNPETGSFATAGV